MSPKKYVNHSGTDSEDSSDEMSSEDEDEAKMKGRAWTTNWCKWGHCKKEVREIDCLCCQEVDTISEEKFEGQNCVTQSEQFKTLCLNKFVLQNVLVGFHETRGDVLEKENEVRNKSLRFAAYKQFIWWIFHRLGKGNRCVIPSCVVWAIRTLYPEANGQYILFNEGEYRHWSCTNKRRKNKVLIKNIYNNLDLWVLISSSLFGFRSGCDVFG